jgi:hypothetical protein
MGRATRQKGTAYQGERDHLHEEKGSHHPRKKDYTKNRLRSKFWKRAKLPSDMDGRKIVTNDKPLNVKTLLHFGFASLFSACSLALR